MDTRIHPGNPFGHTRHGFAWEHVPAASVCHLDFGCYDGRLLDVLHRKGVARVVGADASSQAVQAGCALFPAVEFHHLTGIAALPWPDGTFTSITLLDVLEHVDDQHTLLNELRRVLRDDGLFVITVPKWYLFSCLDRGNYKFMFPRLHRWCFTLRYSRAIYEQRYRANPDGLIGDISVDKRWHEHFTPRHLAKVLDRAGFEPILFDGSGFWGRVTSHFAWLLGWIPGVRRLRSAVDELDGRLFKSMNLFCLARKKRRD